MIKPAIALAISVAVLAVAGVSAHAALALGAASEFDINFSGSDDSGSGTITARQIRDGTYQILGGSFTLAPSTAQNYLDGTYTVLAGHFMENAQGTCDLWLVFSDPPTDNEVNSSAASPTQLGILCAGSIYLSDFYDHAGARTEPWSQNDHGGLEAYGPSGYEGVSGVVTIGTVPNVNTVGVPEPVSTATYAGLSALGLLGLVTLRERRWLRSPRPRFD
jgi:hypothetical protein